jgi:VWFA-related protein
MRHSLIALLGPALLTLPSFAQNSPAPATVLQAGTQLVVVDVVAQDKNGNPIHGLKASDFQIAESGTQQTIRNFEEHTPTSVSGPAPAPLHLSPGIFTNYTPIKPSETLNVLLIDALNTPTKDQSFVRQQLLKYVQNAPVGTHLAIFGLNTHLTLLQSFTADPAILKDAVEHKLIPRASALLDDATGTNANPESLSDQISDQAADASGPMAAVLTAIAANVADFEAESNSFQTGLRVQYTLDAFNTLAHYLGAFQGRKNLIWFSGSFPISILPDPDAKGSVFAGVESKSEEFQETSALLSRAQVAVYPVDARGLMANTAFDAASSGPSIRDPRAFAKQVTKFTTSQADEHGTMDELANDTGGRAFYNTNGLAEATRKAIDAGANYYTLTYTPADHRQDGSFRKIHVTLTDGKSATLSYRRGYIAEKPAPPLPPMPEPATTASTPAKPAATTLTSEQESARHAASAYAHAAMARGAPTPEDILFKVRVLPASTTTEPAIAAGNQLGSYKVSGPYQRYDLDFVALPASFNFPAQPDGNRSGAIEFLAFVYTSDGRLINAADKAVAARLTPENYPRFMKEPVQYHLEISAPAHTETYLRIAVRDVVTNRFGVIEIPASTVAHLPPPVYPVAPKPASSPATPPTATTAPSNPATSNAVPPR